MKYRSLLTTTVALAAVLSTTAACSTSPGTSAGGGESGALKMALSYQRSIYWLPLLVAQNQGYFQQEAVKISLQETEGSSFVTQQVIAGNVPVGWAGSASVAVAFSKDDSLRALMCSPPTNIFRLVTLKSTGVRSVEDLKGKTLGITEKGGGEMPVVRAAMAAAGLEPGSDVRLLPIGGAGPAAVNAIRESQVDAYAGSYPDITTMSAEGLNFRDITPTKYNAIPGDCMFVKQSTLNDQSMRKKLADVARAWAKGAVFAAANPEAATKIACQEVPQECQNMDFAMKYVRDTIDLMGLDRPGPYGSVGLSSWQVTFNVLKQSDIINTGLNPKELAASKTFTADYGHFNAAAIEEEAKKYGSN